MLDAPSLPPPRWFASTDPQHKNKDYLLLKPGETRRIPLAVGRLERLWGTASQPEKIVLRLDNGQPVELLRDGRSKQGQIYEKAFTFYPTKSTPKNIRDLKNGASLVVVNRDAQPNKFFYQVALRTSTKRATSTRGGWGKSKTFDASIPPGKERVWQPPAVGVLSALNIAVNPNTLDAWRNLRLRARWDAGSAGSAYSVDVPLLALTGQFFEARPMRSAGVAFDGKALLLHWPMPYGKGAQLSFFNSGSTTIRLQASRLIEYAGNKNRTPPYRFCAAYGSARTQRGQPVRMLNVSGEGAFVGLALGIQPLPGSPRRTFAYLEGNETITADGTKYEGTGTEDFFNSAWYFPDKPFALPYHGMTFKSKAPPQVSAYRLMIPDAVPFKNSLNFAFEHGRNNNTDDLLYQWVAFWYQKPPLKFEVPSAAAESAGAAQAKDHAAAAPDTGPSWVRPFLAALGALLIVFVIRIVARRARRPAS